MIDTQNINNLMGATVLDSDDKKVGRVAQVYVDPDNGQPNWMSVHTGLFGTSESFVPLESATLNDDNVRVPFEKDFIKDAPRIDTDGALSPADEDELYRYYGMGSGAGSTGTDTSHSGARDQGGVNELGMGADPGHTGPRTGTERGEADRDNDRGPDGAVGHDTSGPTTDAAMTRSEEKLRVSTRNEETGRARLRKHVVTENQNVTVPVQREEVRLEREPIMDANRGDAVDGPAISEEEHEVILNEERVVVDKETVPVERVRLDKETVTDQQQVNEEVRKEQIDLDGDDTDRAGRGV